MIQTPIDKIKTVVKKILEVREISPKNTPLTINLPELPLLIDEVHSILGTLGDGLDFTTLLSLLHQPDLYF